MCIIVQGLLFIYLLLASIYPAVSQHLKVEKWYDAARKNPKEVYYVLQKNPSVLDSIYTSFYFNGKPKVIGFYTKNKATGPWEYYYENGNLKMKGVLKDQLNEGTWQYYYENGNLNMEGEMLKGIREGEWKYYYENEKLKSRGFYRKDKKEELWKYFYEDGGLKAEAVFENDKGKYVEVYPTGKLKAEGPIISGKSNGLWKYYYESGELKGEGQEKNGVKEGMWKFYHPNGKLMSEGIYINGQPDGNWKYYHDNGALSSVGIQKQGKKDGYWKIYYKSGVFKGAGNFTTGDGSYQEFYESGKLKLEGFIKNEKNEGLWKYFHENGTMEGTCFFNNGQGKYTGYYENGKISMEGMIIDGNKSGIWTLYKEDGSIAGYYKTFYENDVEVFKEIHQSRNDSIPEDSVRAFAKPKLKIPKKKSRYFTPRINEFRSIIVSSNPFGLMFSQLPINLEYYFQERLGFEIGGTLLRNPFFSSSSSIGYNRHYTRGVSAFFRQKFYQRDQEIGMFYFAYELRLSKIDHMVGIRDTTIMPIMNKTPKIFEYLGEYSIIIGDRIMSDAKRKGWTIDLFVGIGVGYRFLDYSWGGDAKKFEKNFTELRKHNITIPVRFGINFGYAFKKIKLN